MSTPSWKEFYLLEGGVVLDDVDGDEPVFQTRWIEDQGLNDPDQHREYVVVMEEMLCVLMEGEQPLGDESIHWNLK